MKRRTRDLLIGVSGGAAASLAMDLVQSAWDVLFERRASGDRLDEETEALDALVNFARRSAPAMFGRADRIVLRRAFHYAFGITIAVAYVKAAPRRASLARGAFFGFALWAVNDRYLIPTLKLGRLWTQYSTAERLNALASHLAYGTVLEGCRAFPLPDSA